MPNRWCRDLWSEFGFLGISAAFGLVNLLPYLDKVLIWYSIVSLIIAATKTVNVISLLLCGNISKICQKVCEGSIAETAEGQGGQCALWFYEKTDLDDC